MVNNMIKELDNFIIESTNTIDYFDDIVSSIIDNEKEILNFFKLDRLENKCHIIIMNYDTFKEFIIKKYGYIKEYMRADADHNTNTIRVLDINDQIKYTTHKDANVDNTLKTILHEIVHICHDEINTDYNETIWFNEGIATNISKQNYKLVSLDDCDFNMLKKDFSNVKNNYSYAYTIVNYILNNYDKEEIYRFCKDSSYLRERSNELFKRIKASN